MRFHRQPESYKYSGALKNGSGFRIFNPICQFLHTFYDRA